MEYFNKPGSSLTSQNSWEPKMRFSVFINAFFLCKILELITVTQMNALQQGMLDTEPFILNSLWEGWGLTNLLLEKDKFAETMK